MTYSKYKNEITSLKKEVAPLALPFILLVKGEKWSHFIEPDLNIIDEIVPIPTQTPILLARVGVMLTIRKHSLVLKKKNEQLQEKNAQLYLYEQALDAANSGIVITDANQNDNPIIYTNQAFQNIPVLKKTKS